MNWKDIGTRAALTFVQAFLAVLLVDGINGIDGVEDVTAPFVAGLAAVLSLAYNMVRQYQEKRGWDK